MWESETLCSDCHSFSWRAYQDPDFLFPEVFEKVQWQVACKSQQLALGS